MCKNFAQEVLYCIVGYFCGVNINFHGSIQEKCQPYNFFDFC